MSEILQKRLKEARKKKGVTQPQVEKGTGIKFKTLGGYENGVSEPDLETLNKLANFYEVSIDWLSGNTNNPEVVLDENKRKAANAVLLDDEAAFMAMDWINDGQELTDAQKKKLFDMARLILREDH